MIPANGLGLIEPIYRLTDIGSAKGYQLCLAGVDTTMLQRHLPNMESKVLMYNFNIPYFEFADKLSNKTFFGNPTTGEDRGRAGT